MVFRPLKRLPGDPVILKSSGTTSRTIELPREKIDAPQTWAIERHKVDGAAALATVERLEDVQKAPGGALVRVRPALGEDGETLKGALLGAGAGAVRVEPGAVEGMPELDAPDPDGTPRELALARARGLKTEHAGEVVAEVERGLTAGGL